MMTVILGGMLARYYGGNLTRRAVNSLVWGRTLSLIAKGVLIFLVFNLLVFLLSPRNVFFFCEAARGFIGDPASLYSGIMAMKEPLRKSATTQLALSPVLSLIPIYHPSVLRAGVIIMKAGFGRDFCRLTRRPGQ